MLKVMMVGLGLLILCATVGAEGTGKTVEEKLVATNLYLVDVPTANTLLRGTYNTMVRIYASGGFLTKFTIGFHDRFLIGGGINLENVIGTGNIEVQSPRFIAKFKIVEEGRDLPAWSIGYDGVGYGYFNTDSGVWSRKQKGFYTAVTKEFREAFILQGTFGLARIDSRLYDPKRDMIPFLGLAANITKEVGVTLEYDDWFRDNGGTVNAGLGFSFDPIKIDFDFRELMHPGEPVERSLKIEYTSYI